MSTWNAKISKKNFFFTVAFWDNPHFLFWDLRSRDLKIFFGYDLNYLSIWPFMGLPWFPTRKASKLIFVCFQLAGEWHHPASWKQANVSFEAFLVGNQGWHMKGQMLRQLISYPKNIFRFIRLSMRISFFDSIHQVDMKNESKTFFPISRLYIPTVS